LKYSDSVLMCSVSVSMVSMECRADHSLPTPQFLLADGYYFREHQTVVMLLSEYVHLPKWTSLLLCQKFGTDHIIEHEKPFKLSNLFSPFIKIWLVTQFGCITAVWGR